MITNYTAFVNFIKENLYIDSNGKLNKDINYNLDEEAESTLELYYNFVKKQHPTKLSPISYERFDYENTTYIGFSFTLYGYEYVIVVDTTTIQSEKPIFYIEFDGDRFKFNSIESLQRKLQMFVNAGKNN